MASDGVLLDWDERVFEAVRSLSRDAQDFGVTPSEVRQEMGLHNGHKNGVNAAMKRLEKGGRIERSGRQRWTARVLHTEADDGE